MSLYISQRYHVHASVRFCDRYTSLRCLHSSPQTFWICLTVPRTLNFAVMWLPIRDPVTAPFTSGCTQEDGKSDSGDQQGHGRSRPIRGYIAGKQDFNHSRRCSNPPVYGLDFAGKPTAKKQKTSHTPRTAEEQLVPPKQIRAPRACRVPPRNSRCQSGHASNPPD